VEAGDKTMNRKEYERYLYLQKKLETAVLREAKRRNPSALCVELGGSIGDTLFDINIQDATEGPLHGFDRCESLHIDDVLVKSRANREEKGGKKSFIRLGNSKVILINDGICKRLGWEWGDEFTLREQDGTVVIEKVGKDESTSI
jgi:hypothetical protein